MPIINSSVPMAIIHCSPNLMFPCGNSVFCSSVSTLDLDEDN